MTLLPDAFEQDKVRELVGELSDAGFKCYETRVGGDGFGVRLPTSAEDAAEARIRFQQVNLSAELADWPKRSKAGCLPERLE